MKRITNHSLGGETGSILIVTLLIIFAVSVMGAMLAMISSTDLKISGNQRMTTEAFTIAEAGLNEAIHRLSLPNPTNATVGGWNGNIAISDAEPYNPNWEARIYTTSPGGAPAGGANLFSTGTIQDPGLDYLLYSRASGTDEVLNIVHKWVDRNGNSARDLNEVVRYDPERIPPENFTSGFPVEMVTVTGRQGNAIRRIQAEVTKKRLLARTLGAMYINKAITVSGTPDFCGHNHDLNTPVGLIPPACFAWHVGGGHLVGIATTGGEVNVQGNASQIVGDPTPTDTSSTNPFFTLAEVLGISDFELSQMLNSANNTSIVDPLDGITYINGNATVNSNLTGSGLLYVNGDLNASGGFEYKGLIYVEGDLKLTGNPWVLGSVIVKGTADYQSSAGNAAVLYSKDAIQTYIGRFLPALVLSWREL